LAAGGTQKIQSYAVISGLPGKPYNVYIAFPGQRGTQRLVRIRVKDAEVIDGDVRFCLVLPREAVSVPVMRRVLGGTLLGFGADEDCVADLLLAASEACTNVLRHGDRADEYEVSASVERDACLLEIANGPVAGGARIAPRPGGRRRIGRRVAARANGNGNGSAPAQTVAGDAGADELQESGRGLTIMRACVDDLTLRGTPGRGTVVSMRKQITWGQAVNGRHAGGAPQTTALREAG
jgi:serine/threonine-protein kinase RsbW